MFNWTSLLWRKIKYRVKAFNDMKYNIDWGNTYEEEKIAREKDRQWTIKLKKYQMEAWAFFGLFIIELDRYLKDEVRSSSPMNFDLVSEYQVYMWGREKKIKKLKSMVKFMRHGFCHPEKDSSLRLDPYISAKLKKGPEKQDESFYRVHFLEDPETNKYYVQIGGGKLYFHEIERATKEMKKEAKRKQEATLKKRKEKLRMSNRHSSGSESGI